MLGIVKGINNVFNLFFFLIILRIFLSWIPSVNWFAQPWQTIREVCDAYLDIFKKFIPPFNGLDFSPIIALLVLQLAQNIIVYALTRFI